MSSEDAKDRLLAAAKQYLSEAAGAELITKIETVRAKVEAAKEGNLILAIPSLLPALIDLGKDVVRAVESASAEAKTDLADMAAGTATGAAKLAAATELLDSLIQLPPLLEWADGLAIKAALKEAVKYLNAKLGHDWSKADAEGEIQKAAESVAPEKEGVMDRLVGLVQGKLGRTRTVERTHVLEEETPTGHAEDSAPEGGLTKEEAAVAVEKLRAELSGETKATATPAGKSPGRFESCVSAVLGFEGGESDDPNDKGGHTNLGITAGTLARAVKAGIVTRSNVSDLTRADAAKIYKALYWDAIKGDLLPQPLDLILFDAAVNCGVGAAVKLLQESLNSLLPGTPLLLDGGFGPKTMNALTRAVAIDGGVTTSEPRMEPHAVLRYLAVDVLLNRVELYDAIADRDATQRTYFRGWIHQRVVGLETKAGLEG